MRFAEVVVLMMDAQNRFEEQDLRIADLIEREGRALVIAINKWDMVEGKPGQISALRRDADHWLRAAAHESRSYAARVLAGDAIDVGQWEVAANWLTAPASTGNVDALLDYAALAASGRLGKDKAAEGIALYRQLADGGIAEARRQLAMRAINGEGIDKSPAQAEAWRELSAKVVSAKARHAAIDTPRRVAPPLSRGEFQGPAAKIPS